MICGRTRENSIARFFGSSCSSSSGSPSPPMRLAPASPDTAYAPPVIRTTQSSTGLLSAERGFAGAAALLVVATVASRLPFMTQTLYAFDSANYALAVRDFYSVAFHQPHPPGYPLYVFFARGIDLLVHDANRSLILEGIGWSALAVACTIGL